MLASKVLGVRKNFIGIVVSTAMQKTVKIRVPKRKMHPIVGKEILQHKNYLVHDELEQCKLGDLVRIEHCKKLSKKKSFAVAELIRPAKIYIDPETGKELR
ncbi:hypothetical protein BB559_003019 [Furculomyces boomerangus]|uniref:30S ribosomal protein S17 n=1 Tax=Furculomyces boomerangus TaxID=61424 RepID=A0A2T9YPY4_9FUNG|nr:hypothetical protein BB559_003019 [Furculomyces boomerangus]